MKTTLRFLLLAMSALGGLFLLSAPSPAQAAKEAASGSALFGANCASCHGSSGKGDGLAAVKLTPKPANLTKSTSAAEQIAAVVRGGKRACPSWSSSLSEPEIVAVAAYAKSLQQ